MICFTIYIIADIALALQNNYVALLILRMLQSAGSSGTVAIANAVVADVATSAERGLYIGITSLTGILAPSLGPILGGVISQYGMFKLTSNWAHVFRESSVQFSSMAPNIQVQTPSPKAHANSSQRAGNGYSGFLLSLPDASSSLCSFSCQKPVGK